MTRCPFCGNEIDPADRLVWRRVTGWERKGIGQARRGGSDIVLREPTGEAAHPECIDREQSGIHYRQETLI